MNRNLRTVDRLTLQARRAVNVLGWSAVALLVAVLGHLLYDVVITTRLEGCCGVGMLSGSATGQDAAATMGQYGLRAVLSLLVGLVIGAIIGEYVRGRLAVVVAGMYAVLAVAAVVPSGGFVVESSGGSSDGTVHHSVWPDQPWLWLAGYVLIILITVPVAGLVANRLNDR